jgi:hypothetical protein
MFGIHLLQRGQSIIFVLMIDQRVDVSQFLHDGGIVLATCQQERKGRYEWDDNAPEMFYLTHRFRHGFPTFTQKNGSL